MSLSGPRRTTLSTWWNPCVQPALSTSGTWRVSPRSEDASTQVENAAWTETGASLAFTLLWSLGTCPGLSKH